MLAIEIDNLIKTFDNKCTINNEDAQVKRQIGLLVEAPALFPYSSAYKNMILQAYNLGIKKPYELIVSCLDRVGLHDVEKKKVKNFSLGIKQRLAIAISLLGNPFNFSKYALQNETTDIYCVVLKLQPKPKIFIIKLVMILSIMINFKNITQQFLYTT